MKVLAFFALSAVATAAMAVQPANTLTIEGQSVQNSYANGTTIRNTSGSNNEALQNISTNAGPVHIYSNGSSRQTTNFTRGMVSNEAKQQDAVARQNLASNNGAVEIRAYSEQTVNGTDTAFINEANGSNARATQNIASNFGHVVIAANSYQTVGYTNTSVTNWANGSNSYAVQNISSNDACADDPCPGGNCSSTKPPKHGGRW